MARKSKFFRVAVEGKTCDKRTIEKSWLLDAAATYNREKYAARVWLEHIRGAAPESPFGAYGDVVALKTDTVVIDGEQRLALYAQVEPNPSLVALNKRGRALYSSVEIDPDFAESGRAYLVGLGVTDSPASLGTEALTFSAANPDTALSRRKLSASNVFTVAEPIELSFDEAIEPAPQVESLFNKVRSLLGRRAANDDARFADVNQAVEAVAQAAGEAERIASALRGELARFRTETENQFADMRGLLDSTPNGVPARPAAIGGGGSELTDC
ncbi:MULTISPECIES: GPO family capsid scaffolding protein [Lysobacter]|uniref:GPO family capsid scaffolding protein n=1 Tax=Lysobacter TaxID=68 RepID=UPI001F29AF89|nr:MULTISPECIES: GPO family capsid scaffolding protein [Lysobacter]UJB17553.1 GPO family capsid scaffolding protein [Lysobacter capsici]UJQ28725.1 GPO family capsid scaffolding protein [Lysobacter gummosus]